MSMNADILETLITSSIDNIDSKIAVAKDELNASIAHPFNRKLRLNLLEIRNIICVSITEASQAKGYEIVVNQFVEDSMDELSEQIYLSQFPNLLPEVMSEFREDFVKIISENSNLMGPTIPVLNAFKIETYTGLDTDKKFRNVANLVTDLLNRIRDEDHPEYVFMVLDEVIDFASCMILEPRQSSPENWIGANDNNEPPTALRPT